jgi:hypothetical protein
MRVGSSPARSRAGSDAPLRGAESPSILRRRSVGSDGWQCDVDVTRWLTRDGAPHVEQLERQQRARGVESTLRAAADASLPAALDGVAAWLASDALTDDARASLLAKLGAKQ